MAWDINFNVKFSDLLIKVVTQDSPTLSAKLDEVISAQAQTKELLMAISQQMKDVLDAIDNETNAVAAELQAIKDQLAAGMSPTEVQSVQDRLNAISTRLTGIAADPNNPVPAPTPAP